ncbi:hypothetical protein AB0C15_24205 [Micromonospora sp. NPDC048835]|uniref:hypothetical protein n=1 Tax=Micromonospora sp. NPDC048835 TaxID=3155147 RepID=UPI00340552BB
MALPFVVALRGYDMRQVESLFAEVDEAVAADSAVLRAAARDTLRATTLRRRLRGYAPRDVDAAIAQRLAALAQPGTPSGPTRPPAITPLPFVVALGGYDMRQVESLFAEVDEAVAADSAVLRAAARDTLRTATLRRRLRGYACRAVDDAVAERLRAL